MAEVKANEIYTLDETTDLLKISESTFFRLVKKGILRAAKVGGQYRVLGQEILHLVSPQLERKAIAAYKRVKSNIKERMEAVER